MLITKYQKNFFYKNGYIELKNILDLRLLRKIKNYGYKNISVTPIPNKDIGVALNDRLKRSAK